MTVKIWWLLIAPVLIDDARLDRAREVNLRYAANMPNFVADETARRFTATNKSPGWRYADTIESEITIKGNQANRQHVRREGKPWVGGFETLRGFRWSGGFGTEIRPLFDPQCPTTIDYEGPAELRGRQLLDYRFTSAKDGCFAIFYFESQLYNPARTGHAFIDGATGNLMQFEEEASEFPADFAFAYREERVVWDYVKIGDATHLLPVSANFVVHYTSGARWRIEVEFKNHRHFEASSNLTFH
jgi:hypothetical protein